MHVTQKIKIFLTCLHQLNRGHLCVVPAASEGVGLQTIDARSLARANSIRGPSTCASLPPVRNQHPFRPCTLTRV